MSPDAPLQRLLDRLQGVNATGSGCSARCPAHDDQHASLSISLGEDGRVLLHCHAGCPVERICGAIGFKLSDLFVPRTACRARAKIATTYEYRDAAGVLLYEVVRYEPKRFRQRRPDGNGGWIWNLGETPRVLYRLPELIAAERGAWVYVVEGEKDADNLRRCGAVATTSPQGAGKWNKLADDSALNGRRVAIISDQDAPGRAHAHDVARRLFGRVADLRMVELPGKGKDVSDWLAAGGTIEQLRELVEAAPPYVMAASSPSEDRSGSGGLPEILLDTHENRVISAAITALAADTGLYQRAGVLVRVLRPLHPGVETLRAMGPPTIDVIPAANLRDRMTTVMVLLKVNREGEELPAHPPMWLVNGIVARGEWPGIRLLHGVSDAPVLRPDGSLWQTAGYDERTGVLYEPVTALPNIPDQIDLDDARAAANELLDVVCDFPFEARPHSSAWLAGLLTPLARFAFAGPTPCFVIDANAPAAGKTLLAQVIGRIALGRELSVSSYSRDSVEMRKQLTASAIAGDLILLFDNIDGSFGNDALDRALTCTRWQDRLLGKSQRVELSLTPTWLATGNNVQLGGDTARRIIHVRLNARDERPEDRMGFKHSDLPGWVTDHRGRLLTCAITILAAYCRAGRPPQNLPAFGGFEGWSSVIREAIVWVGLPDPCLTRAGMIESADVSRDALGQLIGAWKLYAPNGGLVISELLNTLYPPKPDDMPCDEASKAMRAALENLVGGTPGQPIGAKQVGSRLRRFRERAVDGHSIDMDQTRGSAGRVWRLKGPGDRK